MNNVLQGFHEKKKKESPFISLKDGESIKIVGVNGIKTITKAGFNGEEKEVLRLTCLVAVDDGVVVQKNFDNGTTRFVDTLINSNIDIGSSFTLTRHGSGSKDTRYEVSNVVNPTKSQGAPTPAKATQAVPPSSSQTK